LEGEYGSLRNGVVLVNRFSPSWDSVRSVYQTYEVGAAAVAGKDDLFRIYAELVGVCLALSFIVFSIPRGYTVHADLVLTHLSPS